MNVLREGHRDDCRATDHLGVYDGFEMRDSLGRKYRDGRGYWWDRWGCNDGSCRGVTLVRRAWLDQVTNQSAEDTD